jgi:CRP-like cAMP-binding protein
MPISIKNILLRSLPESSLSRILPHLESIRLDPGTVLYESGSNMDYAYFPTTAIVSLLYITKEGATSEIAMIGNEGIVGIPLFMGGQTTTNLAIVTTAGLAFRLPAMLLHQEFHNNDPLQYSLLIYTQQLITQIAQSVVCNRHHSIEQRLSRWLLGTLDRLPNGEIVMTQDLISNLLGVRREGITESSKKLQELELIQNRRGHITVLDRIGLENRACECYEVVMREEHRLHNSLSDAGTRISLPNSYRHVPQYDSISVTKQLLSLL